MHWYFYMTMFAKEMKSLQCRFVYDPHFFKMCSRLCISNALKRQPCSCYRQKQKKTRMHSSRMHTDHWSDRHYMYMSVLRGLCLERGSFPPGVSVHSGASLYPPHPPRTEWHMLLKTLHSLAVGNNQVFHKHTKLAILALLPILYSNTFAVSFIICNTWFY